LWDSCYKANGKRVDSGDILEAYWLDLVNNWIWGLTGRKTWGRLRLCTGESEWKVMSLAKEDIGSSKRRRKHDGFKISFSKATFNYNLTHFFFALCWFYFWFMLSASA
jgi:hypothetical protein